MSWFISTASPHAWSVEKVPSLKGRVFLVTGGYGGIGLETAKQLLKKDGKVYIAGRSEAKYQEALVPLEEEIQKPDVHFLDLDLSDLNSVKKAAHGFLSLEKRLDVLLNNAGITLSSTAGRVSPQGYELAFATNALGHYYFTKLLLPILEETGSIDVNSERHRILPNDECINYDSFKDGALAKRLGGDILYAQGKASSFLYSQALSRRYKGEQVVFTSLHPGVVNTEILRDFPRYVSWLVDETVLQERSGGRITSLYAATSDAVESINGAYILPGPAIARAKEELYNPELQDKLVGWMDQQIDQFEHLA